MGVGSRITFWTIAAYLIMIHVTWFTVQIALSSLPTSSLVSNNGTTGLIQPSTDSVNFTTSNYVWRNIFLAVSLGASWFAERYPLSRAASLTSFVVTTVLTFSWISMNLFYTYSIFNQTATSYHTEFCQASVKNSYCELTVAVGVLSVMHICGIFGLWLLSLYQIARSELNPNPTKTERISRYLIYLGLSGVVVWSMASIPLNSDQNSNIFSTYDISANYEQGYQWATIAGAFGSAAWIGYGATKGAKWIALLLNSILFLNMLPPFIYDAKQSLNCPPVHPQVQVGNWHCQSSKAIAAGEGIVSAVALFLTICVILLYIETDAYEIYRNQKVQHNNNNNETSITQEPLHAV